MTSAGHIMPLDKPLPYFVLIEKALRDEGLSYHYVSPSQYSHIDKKLLERVRYGIGKRSDVIYVGASWTTDAPFRETEPAIEYARSQGIAVVEMEAAALYAFASAKNKPIVCLAHVTNQMGNLQGDFEKGPDNGSTDALKVISSIAGRWLEHKDKV
jgi:purine-nucleoside phosphorylase